MAYKIAAAQHNNIQQTNSTHFFSFYCILYEDLNLDTMIDLFFDFSFFLSFQCNNIFHILTWWTNQIIKTKCLQEDKSIKQTNTVIPLMSSVFYFLFSLCKFLASLPYFNLVFSLIYITRGIFSVPAFVTHMNFSSFFFKHTSVHIVLHYYTYNRKISI